MDRLITIDGREFHGVTQELSAGQDDYLVGHLRLAGALDSLLGIKEEPEEQAERLLTTIMVSGRAAHVLAGCLTENGKSWTFEEAEKNAARFAATTNLQDKTAMRDALVGFVAGFFLFVLQSSRISE